ncbi:MAG TPA: branched-chain amino acid ABC transporter permease [Azospirillaceae bacterium]|nr:branched-chain amino acid ABC transporter permease [Azospirillaceae bacterium]
MSVYRLIFGTLAAVLLVALPPTLGLGWQNTLTDVLIASLFAAAFNLLMGQGGMLSFGHAAYYGLGAFAVLHLMGAIENGFPFPTPLLPLAGGLAGLIAGLGAGYFATQRTGVYFSLVTLALAEMPHALAPHWKGAFGGESGLSSMRMPSMGFSFGSSLEVYYVTLAWVVACIALLYAYTHTPFGRLTLALRDNEQRVRFMGYNAHATKTLVFGISAMFSGVAGGLLAMSSETANYSIFSTQVSAQVVLHTIVGGSGLFFGPIIGASVLTLFTFLMSEMTRSWLLYQGIIFTLVMLYAPSGIGSIIQAHIVQRSRLPWGRLVLPYTLSAIGILLAAAAIVFVVQMSEHIFSQSYRAMIERTGAWEPVVLFSVSWQPLSPATWIPPLIAFAAGFLLLTRLRGTIARLWHEDRRDPDPSVVPAHGTA